MASLDIPHGANSNRSTSLKKQSADSAPRQAATSSPSPAGVDSRDNSSAGSSSIRRRKVRAIGPGSRPNYDENDGQLVGEGTFASANYDEHDEEEEEEEEDKEEQDDDEVNGRSQDWIDVDSNHSEHNMMMKNPTHRSSSPTKQNHSPLYKKGKEKMTHTSKLTPPLLNPTQNRKEKRKNSSRTSSPPSDVSGQVVKTVILESFRLTTNTLLFAIRLLFILFSSLLPILPYLLGPAFILFVLYSGYAYTQGGFVHLVESINPFRILSYISSKVSAQPLLEISYGVHRLVIHSSLSIASLYCSTIGIGCEEGRKFREQQIGGVARVARQHAEQAMDIFQSVLVLGGAHHHQGDGSDSDGVSMINLHHVELWELSSAVRHTSALENREFLGDQLQELGDMTREVRDEIVRLNSLGINSFTWIVNEFTILERLVEQAQQKPSVKNSEKLENRLNILFERLSRDLDTLLASLDRAIPVADRASGLGHKLIGALHAESHKIEKEKGEMGIWRSIVERQSWKGKQLRRDLRLAQESVGNVKLVREGLERTRSSFIEYSTNVGLFKAGVVGFHLAGHDLSPEEEVASLGEVMGQFRETLAVAKQRGKRAQKPPTNAALLEDGRAAT